MKKTYTILHIFRHCFSAFRVYQKYAPISIVHSLYLYTYLLDIFALLHYHQYQNKSEIGTIYDAPKDNLSLVVIVQYSSNMYHNHPYHT